MFPPKKPVSGAGAPRSMRDIRLGVQKAPGAAVPGGSSPAICPACGEGLKLSVDKGIPDQDADDHGTGPDDTSGAIAGGGGGL